MPISFRILADRGLVVVRYSGDATINELMEASAAYIAHPNFERGQKQLIDMSDITSFEKDYVRFMEMQAEKTERLASSGVQSFAVYIAPTRISQEVSAMFCQSWAEVDAVTTIAQPTAAAALALLNQPETSVGELLSVAET